MNEEMIFTLLKTVRAGTLQTVEQISKKYANDIDTLPEGYNNNLRWHLGHIVTIMDQLGNLPAGEKSMLPPEYSASFANGTSPDDWNDETPSLEEITTALKEQPEQLQERFAGRLADPLPQVFSLSGVDFDTVGSLLAFNYYHEGMHYGQISGMMRALSLQK